MGTSIYAWMRVRLSHIVCQHILLKARSSSYRLLWAGSPINITLGMCLTFSMGYYLYRMKNGLLRALPFFSAPKVDGLLEERIHLF
jgi:hypothetical protein